MTDTHGLDTLRTHVRNAGRVALLAETFEDMAATHAGKDQTKQAHAIVRAKGYREQERQELLAIMATVAVHKTAILSIIDPPKNLSEKA